MEHIPRKNDSRYRPAMAFTKEEAINIDAISYMGKPCKKGHARRYTANDRCVLCMKANTYTKANKDGFNLMVDIDHLKPEPNIMDDYYTI